MMRFPGFIGPAYKLDSVNVDCQQCVNLFPELNEMGNGKASEVAWLKPTPGLEFICTVGSGPIRLIHFDETVVNANNPSTRIFVVSGNEVYKLINISGTWTPTLLGTIGTSAGPVKAASNNLGIYSDDIGMTVFCDGGEQYLYRRTKNGGASYVDDFHSFSDYGYPSNNPTHVVYQDGFFILNQKDKNIFEVSDWNLPFVDPLSFASAEGDLDNIMGHISNNRDLWLLNERSTEVFANTGNSDFPFERVSGGFIEKGCVARYSIDKIDNNVFWLGRDEHGQGVVYMARGINPERISTHAIESAIQSYSNISNAVAYTYQMDGHSFYVLNFDEATWVYDLTTKLWHQRAYTNAGNLERHRANTHCFIPEFGIHMLGDYSSNKIYKFNKDYYFDDTTEITRLRSSPHVSNSMKFMFHKEFKLDMETGVGVDGSGLGSDPQVILQFSDDGGHTWSNEAWASAGKKIGGIGQYKTRVIWRRLGKSRDRVYRIKITDPVKVALIGAEIDIEVGNS